MTKWVSLTERHAPEPLSRKSPMVFKVIYDDETGESDVLIDADFLDWPWIIRADILSDAIELLDREYSLVLSEHEDALLGAVEPEGNA